MQSYLYRNEERIKSVYSQLADGLISKTRVEHSKSVEVGLGASLLSIIKPSLKGKQGGKKITETVMAPENMVAELVRIVPETGQTRLLTSPPDWKYVKTGDLVVFRGELEFDSFGHTKGELWLASNADLGQRTIHHDLRLKGRIAGKSAEIPFSSNWVTGRSQFTVLCHAMFDFLEGLAIIMSDTRIEPVMLQPLAFGNGFVASE